MFSDLCTFSQATDRLGTRDRRKIGNNTYLERRDAETIAVRLHATDIVIFHSDGSATLHDGGYLTVTTKDRLNKYAPCPRISSVRGRWFVGDAPYFDGVRVSDSGEILNSQDGPDVATEDTENRAMRRRISAYVSLYTDDRIRELVADAQANGTNGDCFFCNMRTTDDGTPAGDAFGDTDHLISHLEEGYTMASLALNALTAKGYRFPAVILHTSLDLVRQAIGTYLRKRLLVGVAVSR